MQAVVSLGSPSENYFGCQGKAVLLFLCVHYVSLFRSQGFSLRQTSYFFVLIGIGSWSSGGWGELIRGCARVNWVQEARSEGRPCYIWDS